MLQFFYLFKYDTMVMGSHPTTLTRLKWSFMKQAQRKEKIQRQKNTKKKGKKSQAQMYY